MRALTPRERALIVDALRDHAVTLGGRGINADPPDSYARSMAARRAQEAIDLANDIEAEL